MQQKDTLANSPHVELHPTRSTESDRAATIMAFALQLQILYTHDDGTIFAQMLPHETAQTDEET